MRCSQCVLTDGMSGVEIGGDGVCNECTASCRPTQPEEIVDPDGYRRMLKRFEGRGDYDCLALVSGGKDSVSMLYELVPVYSMNPLVLTFDYGFDDEQAVGNVWRATQALGTDWIYYGCRCFSAS